MSAMTDAGEKLVTIEQMIEDLYVAGWTKEMAHVWKSPSGMLFIGPAGAWHRMREFPRLNIAVPRRTNGDSLEEQ